MRAKKSLGQNFLKSKEIINIIISTANINKNDIILEIGPGKGILTEKLLEKSKKVIAIEKDDNLIIFLEEKFEKYIKSKELEIINIDVLDLEINNKGIFFNKKQIIKSNYKIVANIPYYITGQIFKKFLSSNFQPQKMVLMVQKEVAKRIVDNKKESILSLSVKVFGEPKYIKTVKSKYFSPEPKVDSAVLLINNISKNFFKELFLNSIFNNKEISKKEDNFFKIIKTGFSHKRKFLIGNLGNIYNKRDLEIIFEKIKIPLKTRAENLNLEDWKNLVKNL